eukprot:CAMPEP_0179439612 /NCGR_PEP_ID=MMETSP0799-20121207/23242_1 /TAXON_ID=46947 /ORGANISM="Geminigera cryophila, Strain CCMP2564" /LENGTH=76 /DNA_ID=CAMNT_0021222197 /DNA_START=320 /DNA_END=550 /DNA_ORIENTATION=+
MNGYAKRKDIGGLCGKMSKAIWCQSDSHLVNSVYGVGFVFDWDALLLCDLCTAVTFDGLVHLEMAITEIMKLWLIL